MIRIHVNGQPKALEDSTTIERLVCLLELKNPHIAVAVNYDVIPRSEYARLVVRDGDKVDIVKPVQGG